MNIHDILLTIQYITIGVLFVEVLIVFLRWKNTIHSYLFLAFISSLISNIGYLFELKAESEEAYMFALKLSYVGRVWIVFAFFLFSAKMCHVKIPNWLIALLVLLHVGVYLCVLTIGSNSLYYTDYRFVSDPVMPSFEHGNGIAHDLLMGFNATGAFFAIGWLVREFKRAKDNMSKMRLFMLILSFGVQILALILHILGVFKISKYYDLTMAGALFGTIFMLIGIVRYNLLGTREIARDFVIDRISEGIIAVDNDGRIQYYNAPAARLYPEFNSFFGRKRLASEDDQTDEDDENTDGQEEADTTQTDVSKTVYTPYDIISHISEAVSKGETLKIGDRIYSPEENDLKFMGESYGKLYALVDDTEHYHYMEELQKQKDIADNANEAKSRFLANMSHEIRTPINAMLGMDEMILRESEEKPIRSYAADIMSAGKTLLSLINDILDLSKVEEGKMEIIPVQYDLSSLINDLVNMTHARAVKKSLYFNVKVDEHVPHLLFGDEIRIKQCAMNILTNAVKYTEKGGVNLTISYEKRDDSHIALTFKVKDTGIGMRAEDMDALFSPYKRIEEKRNRTIEGTGLGMSITRQLLELMDSSLIVESEYGSGSEFSFTITQKVVKWVELGDYSARYDDVATQAYEYHELFHAPDAKILVVDDTEMNLTVIKNLLKKTRIKIDTAGSGREAVKLAEGTAYDAIFIDHMMPDMDGIETLNTIRTGGMSKDVPAVALTANAVSGAREMYLEAGFADYLSKPVDGGKLEKMLYNMIPDEKLTAPDADQAEDFGDTESESASDPMDEIPDWLKNVSDIDVSAGLSNCGDAEGYISVLSVFHQTAGPKADEIGQLYEAGDIENYTIKVHALKSSARIIGAASLSELAKSLEDAGKNKDMAYIDDNTDRLLKMYRSLDQKLAEFDKTADSLSEINPKELKEAYQTIMEIAGSMDYGLMEDILKDLKGYSLAKQDRERIAKIEGMLNSLDWDGIIMTAKEGA